MAGQQPDIRFAPPPVFSPKLGRTEIRYDSDNAIEALRLRALKEAQKLRAQKYRDPLRAEQLQQQIHRLEHAVRNTDETVLAALGVHLSPKLSGADRVRALTELSRKKAENLKNRLVALSLTPFELEENQKLAALYETEARNAERLLEIRRLTGGHGYVSEAVNERGSTGSRYWYLPSGTVYRTSTHSKGVDRPQLQEIPPSEVERWKKKAGQP